ncbi:MAG TPA: polysaccharide biosynthesis tyrosine autokinase [Candidatus Nitrosotenuis sp.]|nr:polysaccharide biosynthesis tyrosine autokinase [Candidatus Nitrosotenuis sp.]
MERKDKPEDGPNPGRAIEPVRPVPAPAPATTQDPFNWRTLPIGSVDPLSSGLPLRDYLRILRKHRWLIISVVLVTVALVTAVSYRMDPIYQSVTRLEISGDTPDLASMQQLLSILPTDEEFLQTQVRILTSDDLALQTIRALRLHEKPDFQVRDKSVAPGTPFTPAEETRLIELFRSNLDVQLLRASRLVEIKFESTDARLASDVANKLAENYIENNFRKKYESTMQAKEWMSEQLRELQDKMEKSHAALVTYEREKQIFAVSEGQNATLQKLGELNKELTLAESERIAKESQLQLVKSRRLEDIPSVAAHPLVLEQQRRLAVLSEELAQSRAPLGPNHPKVQQLEQQIAEVRGQLEREKQSAANRIESEYQAALRREQLLRRAVREQEAAANAMNERLVAYSVLKREYETNQQLYEGLLTRLKEAGVSAGLKANNIHVVDRARPPIRPVRPRKTLNILISLVVGLIVGGLVAIFNEYLDNSVKVPEEVESLVNLPALGIIPSALSVSGNKRGYYGLADRSGTRALPAAGTSGVHELATLSQPHSVIAEAYRALRTAILLSTSKHPPQTILVTSGQPREGKTTTALNLAITLAQRGDRVVLVDSDLRRPRVHRSFGLANDVGLSSYLAGVIGIDDLPRPVPHIPNLYVVSSGPTPPNPAELLSSEPMDLLFRELRRQFDFVVMDSPPTISVADSMILAARADGVILVVHGGVTTRESLRQTHKMLGSVSARMIGVVLNNVDVRSADYQYYYTYYYGDYYRHMLDGYGYGHEPGETDSREEKKIGA